MIDRNQLSQIKRDISFIQDIKNILERENKEDSDAMVHLNDWQRELKGLLSEKLKRKSVREGDIIVAHGQRVKVKEVIDKKTYYEYLLDHPIVVKGIEYTRDYVTSFEVSHICTDEEKSIYRYLK